MLGEAYRLAATAAAAIVAALATVVLGAACQEAGRQQRLTNLRHRRRKRAEAMAELILMMESAESDAPGDLQETLRELGPDWKITHAPYVLAARQVATEFRTIRNSNPNPQVDRLAVQQEIRTMLVKRKCRNKDMQRILPLACLMAFYPSRYEQTVLHAFGTQELRDEVSLAMEPPVQLTLWERWSGVKSPFTNLTQTA